MYFLSLWTFKRWFVDGWLFWRLSQTRLWSSPRNFPLVYRLSRTPLIHHLCYGRNSNVLCSSSSLLLLSPHVGDQSLLGILSVVFQSYIGCKCGCLAKKFSSVRTSFSFHAHLLLLFDDCINSIFAFLSRYQRSP